MVLSVPIVMLNPIVTSSIRLDFILISMLLAVPVAKEYFSTTGMIWSRSSVARERILEGFEGVTVSKVSDEEWSFVLGTDDFAEGAKMLLDRGVRLVARSEGDNGASFATTKHSGHLGPFRVDSVEVTGAGDGAMACLIVELLAHWRKGVGPEELDGDELTRIVRRANAVGALACTKVGAIPSLPAARQVEAFLEQNPPS